jgi:hypothetical protein
MTITKTLAAFMAMLALSGGLAHAQIPSPTPTPTTQFPPPPPPPPQKWPQCCDKNWPTCPVPQRCP